MINFNGHGPKLPGSRRALFNSSAVGLAEPAPRPPARHAKGAGGWSRPVAPDVSERRISLALQGGGSFGAFTWGFLDRLLEEENLTIDMVSGASAGAMNAVLLAMVSPRAARRARASDWIISGIGCRKAASIWRPDMATRWARRR